MTDDWAITDLGIDDVKAGIADGTILLVDVREPNEHRGGMIPGSVAMPLSRFDPHDLPATGRRVVFSCAAGVRSRLALEASHRAGLPFREHLAPGYKGWVAAGEPVAEGPG